MLRNLAMTQNQKGRRSCSGLFGEFDFQPPQNMAGKTGPVTQADITFVPKACHRPIFFIPVIAGNHSDQLFLPYTFFISKLVVTDAGICIAHF